MRRAGHRWNSTNEHIQCNQSHASEDVHKEQNKQPDNADRNRDADG
jgi:hypothetical protein